jgi:hypothetical protein
MSHYVIDRIEGQTAVIEADDGRTFEVLRRELPAGCGEGTVLRADDENPDWSAAQIDEQERLRRLEQARQTIRRLGENDPGGDIKL